MEVLGCYPVAMIPLKGKKNPQDVQTCDVQLAGLSVTLLCIRLDFHSPFFC